ncbi:MAG: hypothetical protein Q7S08_00605 [bacterium]|nr:hypothetical protein [bacterium]
MNRWPHLANRIETDSRLGIERGEEALWAKIDLLHDAYNTIPQAYFAMDPGVMFQSGHALLAASVKCATRVSMGGFGVLCTHFGILDMAIRLARLQMGVTENDGWLPGNGTQSGAFAVLSYTSQWELCHCQYYPVPVA